MSFNNIFCLFSFSVRGKGRGGGGGEELLKGLSASVVNGFFDCCFRAILGARIAMLKSLGGAKSKTFQAATVPPCPT